MSNPTIHASQHPPRWRSGSYPLAWLTLLSGLGFLVQLPVAVELHVVASENAERQLLQDAQHAATVAMALGASALLAGITLRDQIQDKARSLDSAVPRSRGTKVVPSARSRGQRHPRSNSSSFRRRNTHGGIYYEDLRQGRSD